MGSRRRFQNQNHYNTFKRSGPHFLKMRGYFLWSTPSFQDYDFEVDADFSWSRRLFIFVGGSFFIFTIGPLDFFAKLFWRSRNTPTIKILFFDGLYFTFYLGWVPLQKRSRLRSTQTFNFLLFRRPLPKKDQDQDHPFNQNQPLPLYQRSGNFSKIKTKISHNYSITKLNKYIKKVIGFNREWVWGCIYL